MTLWLTCISAFTIGFLGSGHCIGMCGGITSAISLSLKDQTKSQSATLLMGYHIGRIISYSTAGFLLGSIGFFLGDINPTIKIILRSFSGVVLILIGLYISDLWRILSSLETLGKYLWGHLYPLAKKRLSETGIKNALILGMIWGWLPCGLVYSTLLWSTGQGSPTTSALLMICFGLGTTPTLLLTGVLSRQVTRLFKTKIARHTSAILLILFGLWTIPGPHQKYTNDWIEKYLISTPEKPKCHGCTS